MKKSVYVFLIGVFGVLSGCSHDSGSASLLANPTANISEEEPVSGLVKIWDIEATQIKIDDTDFCNNFEEDTSLIDNGSIQVFDSGECENLEEWDEDDLEYLKEEVCLAGKEKMAYYLEFEGEYAGCSFLTKEVFELTLQNDETLNGIYMGYFNMVCNDQSYTCNFEGTLTGTEQSE